MSPGDQHIQMLLFRLHQIISRRDWDAWGGAVWYRGLAVINRRFGTNMPTNPEQS